MAGDGGYGASAVIIRAFSVFEQVIYHCALIDGANPCKPRLEVEAVLRPGDADQGPLLLSVPDYISLAGGRERVAHCLDDFRAAGRMADHLGVAHLTFPFWTPIHVDLPASNGGPPPTVEEPPLASEP